MSTQTQLRRGTEAQCDAMTPALGELIIDTTNNRGRIGNGSTAGGVHWPNYLDIQGQKYTSGTTTGSANAYVLACYKPALSLTGLSVEFKANFTNTGAATINVDSLGAITIKKISAGALADVASGDLVNGVIYRATYNGTYMQLIGAAGGITTVGQGDLRTSIGAVSTTTLADLTLPGGEYGFYPQFRMIPATNSATAYFMAGTNITSSYVTRINLQSSGGNTTSAQQRYVTASPPFDLGDGEAGGFIFLHLNPQGEIDSTYIADVPPWAYNGPTNLRPDRIDLETGKKYRNVLKRLNIEQILEGAPIKYIEEEITNEVKNRDMALIPSPFGDKPGFTTVLLNPSDSRVRDMIELMNNGAGAEVADMLSAGYVLPDTVINTQNKPPGVDIVRMKLKKTR